MNKEEPLSKFNSDALRLQEQRAERFQLYHRLCTSKPSLDETCRLQLQILSIEFFGTPRVSPADIGLPCKGE